MFAAQETSDALSEDELVNTIGTLLIAGHETTTSLVGNGLSTLLRHPEQWQALKDDPSLDPGGDRGDAALREPADPAAAAPEGRRRARRHAAPRRGDRVPDDQRGEP